MAALSAPPPPLRLLAVDLDGTLVRKDGSIAPRDREALALARRAGVIITLATARFAPATIAVARALELDAPSICADGAALVCPRRGALLESAPLPGAEAVIAALTARDLAAFAFYPEAAVGDARAAGLADLIRPWSPDLRFTDRLSGRGPVLMALGLGGEAEVERALDPLESISGAAAISRFPLGATGFWALRAAARGVSKATSLSRLAARLDISRGAVGAIGDFHNDVEMLRWAGRSAAMRGAPEEVTRAARAVVPSVAFAVEAWIPREILSARGPLDRRGESG